MKFLFYIARLYIFFVVSIDLRLLFSYDMFGLSHLTILLISSLLLLLLLLLLLISSAPPNLFYISVLALKFHE